MNGVRVRTRSVPLELLEEEETILNALSIALGPNPPKVMLVGEDQEEMEVVVNRSREGLVGGNLKRVRWECRGLRGGKERVKEIWKERERYKHERT